MRTFLNSILSLLANNLFTALVSLIFSVIMAQRLSSSELGLQGAVVALGNIAMGIGAFNLFNVSMRELARVTVTAGTDRPDQPALQSELLRDRFNSLFTLNHLTFIVAGTVAAGFTWLIGGLSSWQGLVMLLALFSTLVSYAPIVPIEALMVTRGETWRMSILQSSYALWTSLAGGLILLYGGGILGMYLSFAFFSVVMIGWYLWELWRIIPGGPRYVFRPREWSRLLAQGLPGGLGGLFAILQRSVGTYLVFNIVRDGGTSASYMTLSFMVMISVQLIAWVPYSVSILPVLTRLYEQWPERFGWLVNKSIVWLAAIVLPAVIGVVTLAPDLLALLGADKAAAAPTLRLYIWFLPLSILSEFSARLFLVIDRQRRYVIATGLGALFNVLACLLLISWLGAPGAALAALIGGTVTVGLCWHALRQWWQPAQLAVPLLKIALACGIMALVVLAGAGLPVFVRIGIGAISYGVCAWLLGVVRLADYRDARALLDADLTLAPSR